jgi:hypothetical protein
MQQGRMQCSRAQQIQIVLLTNEWIKGIVVNPVIVDVLVRKPASVYLHLAGTRTAQNSSDAFDLWKG